MKRTLLYSGALLLLALVTLECGARWILRRQIPARVTLLSPKPQWTRSPDAGLVYSPEPRTRVRESRRAGGRVLYDMEYETDEFGRRALPVAGRRDHFAAFFGCSYTFGHGLNDRDTLPFLFSEKAANYRPYVYAVNGYGPQQMLNRLERGDLRPQVKEKSGVGIYVYMDHHLARAIGSFHFHNSWGSQFPFYEEGSDGKLHHRGNFQTGRPWRSRFYSLLGRFRFLTLLRMDWPLGYGDEDYEFLGKMVAQSAEAFRAQFPGSEFYAVIFPGFVSGQRLVPWLSRMGVKSLDYSGMFRRDQPEFWIPGDGHPNRVAYAKLAERLARDLKLTSGGVAKSFPRLPGRLSAARLPPS